MAYKSTCGNSIFKSAKLTNTVLTAPAAPTSLTITSIVNNVCGAKKYRYTAPALTASTSTSMAATGYIWSFTGNLSRNPFTDTTNAVIDSGNINSQVIIVRYKINVAAVTGDSVRVLFTSGCGNSINKSTKLTNTAILPPALPASLTITSVSPSLCAARVYRFAAPALSTATTSNAAATGYLWSFKGSLGSNAIIDSGTINSRVIRVIFTSNAPAATGDSIRVLYTSSCGNSLNKAVKLINTALITPIPASITIATLSDVCGYRIYRYTAPILSSSTASAPATIGWKWSFTGSLGSNAQIDSGTIYSRIIRVKYTNYAAALIGDSVRVAYISACDTGRNKAVKLINTFRLCQTTTKIQSSLQKAIQTGISSSSSNDINYKVYPNPSSGNFNLKVTSDNKEKIDAQVMDAQGRLIKRIIFNSNEIISFGNELTPGVYMIKLKEGKEEKSVRVVKY